MTAPAINPAPAKQQSRESSHIPTSVPILRKEAGNFTNDQRGYRCQGKNCCRSLTGPPPQKSRLISIRELRAHAAE